MSKRESSISISSFFKKIKAHISCLCRGGSLIYWTWFVLWKLLSSAVQIVFISDLNFCRSPKAWCCSVIFMMLRDWKFNKTPKCTYNCYNYLIIVRILFVPIKKKKKSTYSTLDIIATWHVEMSFVREGSSTAAAPIYSPGTRVRYLLKVLEPLERLWTVWKMEVNISGVTLTYWIFERSMNIYKGKVLLVERKLQGADWLWEKKRKKNLSFKLEQRVAVPHFPTAVF